MPEKSNRKPVMEAAAEQNTTAVPEKKQEQKYKVEKLRANCMKLFSISTSTFDGAMYGNKETELTINDAKTRINKWLGRKG